jgi:hypothetical protein
MSNSRPTNAVPSAAPPAKAHQSSSAGLIIRQKEPTNLETPFDQVDSYFTPTEPGEYNNPDYLQERHGVPQELLQNIAGGESLTAKAGE